MAGILPASRPATDPKTARFMSSAPAISLLQAVLLLTLAACRPAPPSPQAPAATPPVVRAYAQFSPGDTLDLVRIQLGLDNYEVRYRSSMPQGLMGMVYFLDDGNLHIDAKKVGETWVILSVPLLDPSPLPAADRVAEWDRGADPQNREAKSQK
jgi:hypothetical protein